MTKKEYYAFRLSEIPKLAVNHISFPRIYASIDFGWKNYDWTFKYRKNGKAYDFRKHYFDRERVRDILKQQQKGKKA